MNRSSLLPQVAAYRAAVLAQADEWVPACGGLETPIEVQGRRFLYVFNPKLARHAYLDMDADRVLDDAELPQPLKW